MRLIDADALISQIEPPKDAPNDGAKLLLSVFVDVLKSAPTVDAVQVVRCRECRNYNDGICVIDDALWDSDDFCSYGERREDGDT